MRTFFLKAGFTFCFSALFFSGAWAQFSRFIYIQSQNKAPFYVKIDNRYVSSSTTGYIIIPKLKDSTYSLVIGSPEKHWPNQNITISTKSASAGYLIQNTEEKNVSFVNIQNLKAIAPDTDILSSPNTELVDRDDEFAKILAQVVNDPSIAQIRTEKDIPNTAASKKAVIENQKPVNKPHPPQDNGEIKKRDMEENPVLVKDTEKIVQVATQKNKIVKLDYETIADTLKLRYFDFQNTDTIEIG